MSISADTAVNALRNSADSAVRLGERLGEIQTLLQSEILWVEGALRDAGRAATEPAASAAQHLLGLGGKRVRPAAVLLSAACFGPIPAAARELAVVVELIHTATLLHDDVIDDGRERRGAPAARRIWGNAVSVLAGDSLLVTSLQRTFTHCPQLMPGLLETLQRLVSGEVVQLRGRGELDLSEPRYERILRDKTASLFRFATASGAELGGANVAQLTALATFGECLGIAFQLIDDVLDYTSTTTGKTISADLLEGKITLPLALAAQQNPDLVRAVERVRAGELDQVESVRAHVLASGACDVVRQRALAATSTAQHALECLDPTPARLLLAQVARQVATRSS
jgi:octaprenyl-diphosphate synthase